MKVVNVIKFGTAYRLLQRKVCGGGFGSFSFGLGWASGSAAKTKCAKCARAFET